LQARARQIQQRLSALAGEAHLQAALGQKAALESQLIEAEGRLAGLGMPEQDVERLVRELTELGNPVQERRASLAELDKRPLVQQMLDKVLAERNRLQGMCVTVQSGLGRYADLEQRMATVAEVLRDNLAAHNEYIANTREASEVASREGRVLSLDTQLVEERARLQAAEEALRRAQDTYDATADRQAQQDKSSRQQEMAALNARLQGDRDKLMQTRKEIARLEGLVDEGRSLQADHVRIEQALYLIAWARDLLREAGPHVTRQLVQRVSADAAGLFRELMDDHGSRLMWAEDYALSLDVAGTRRDFVQLSGGEQMCAALALRLALLRNLSGVNVAFFDEPTAHLDVDRRALLAQTLTHVQGFEQIFVISHYSTFEQAAQATFVVTKDGDGSQIERL